MGVKLKGNMICWVVLKIVKENEFIFWKWVKKLVEENILKILFVRYFCVIKLEVSFGNSNFSKLIRIVVLIVKFLFWM